MRLSWFLVGFFEVINMRYYEKKLDCIDLFREQYYFLSNFYPVTVEYDGITYLSSEAAYQAHKCAYNSERLRFSKMSADESKRAGSKVELRPDWEDVKISLMEQIVKAKFTQHRYLAQWLLKTGDNELKEGNKWGDTFWGVDLKTGEGENHLGKILMELRAYFKTNGLPDESETAAIKFDSGEHMSVVFGNITQSDCLCIVNASNNTLLSGRGVDGAIILAAGPELLEECKTLNGCKTGEAKITKGYNLKAKYIIHTVGPRYPQKDCEHLLRQAYRNSLELAKEYRINSIAFPAISTGSYSYPKKEATRIAVETIFEWLQNNPDFPIDVVFTSVDNAIYDYFCEHIENLRR